MPCAALQLIKQHVGQLSKQAKLKTSKFVCLAYKIQPQTCLETCSYATNGANGTNINELGVTEIHWKFYHAFQDSMFIASS